METNYNSDYINNIIFSKIQNDVEHVMPDNFNESLENYVFPDNITSLVFGRFFNQTIKKLPATLKILVFGDSFNKPVVPNTLPDSLICLIFGHKFNNELGLNTLPPNLKYLKFGEKYNKEIKPNVLPDSLVVLEFDENSCFNKKIKKNTLPISLNGLILGGDYSHKIKENRLPPNIEYLVLSTKFDCAIDENVLPKSLKYLSVGNSYNKTLEYIPPSVKVIFFNHNLMRIDTFNNFSIPDTVNKIIIKNIVFENCDLKVHQTLKEIQILDFSNANENMCEISSKINISNNTKLINKFGDIINI